MFHRFPAYFDPFTSIWEILIKMKIDMKNVDFTRFSYKYLICGFNPEISTWKLIFQKVQMILYILPIYHFFISCILNELCSSENTCEIIRFGDKCFKIFTCELTKYTVHWCNEIDPLPPRTPNFKTVYLCEFLRYGLRKKCVRKLRNSTFT